MSAQILGAVLSFATVDGRELALTVSLTEPATAALDWGGLAQRSDAKGFTHTFRRLPVPADAPTAYRLTVAGGVSLDESVAPPVQGDRVRVALYGDNRDGPGPHGALLEQMIASSPTLIVNTGDVVRVSEDEAGWASYLATTFPLSRRVPTILALGNHELSSQIVRGSDARTRVLAHVAAVDDPIATQHGAPRGVFHVRVGPALFVSLDSNSPMGAGSPQLAFVDAVLAAKGDAQHVFLAMHHGPLSAGPHGPNAASAELLALMKRHGATGVLSGHDHTYQRIHHDGMVAIVSGGGGAPLYPRQRTVQGLQVFASAHHWVQMELTATTATIAAFALEGAMLDRATIAPLPGAAAAPDPKLRWLAIAGGQLLVVVVLLTVVLRWKKSVS